MASQTLNYKKILDALIPFGTFAIGIWFATAYHQDLVGLFASAETSEPHEIVESAKSATVLNDVALDAENLEISFQANSHITIPGFLDNLPLVYGESTEESVIQQDLKHGAVVLPLGTSFGGSGNVVVTAHSSGLEAFGPYGKAFAKLSELEIDQEFSITTPTAEYKYKVYGQEIVWPHEVNKLPRDSRSTLTLVTCWPLWTNFQRLLVHAELINTNFSI